MPRGSRGSKAVPAWWSPSWTPGGDADPDSGWASHIAGRETDREVPWTHAPEDQPSGVHGLRTPLDAEFGQVRSRDRVRDLAEVFTHQREIDAMLVCSTRTT